MPSYTVVLDPAVLAFGADLDKVEFVARVTFLAEWASLARSGDVRIQIAPAIRGFLERNGYFPAYEPVAALIESLDLRFRYAPEDVIVAINTILNRAVAHLSPGVTDADHESFVSEPPQPWNPNASINEQTQLALILSTIERHSQDQVPLVFVTRLECSHLQYSARITIVVPETIDGFTAADLPKTLGGVSVVASGIEQVLNCFSAKQLWDQATDNFEIRDAIRIRCREKLKATGSYRSMAEVPEFLVGGDFYASLIGSQAAGAGRYAAITLEACAAAVLRIPVLEWKAFNKPFRKADGAEPLRAHLTKSGPGLRLMAWRRPAKAGGAIEFANVGEKWEEEISYSNPGDAV